MKLRVRYLESRETHKIELPNSSNLLDLKKAIMHQLSLPSSSSSSSSDTNGNLLLSLNRKDEICGSTPEVPLQSLGIASGDLIYYSFDPFAFSQNPNLSNPQSNPNKQNQDMVDSHKYEIDGSDKIRDSNDAESEGTLELRDNNDLNPKSVDSKKQERIENAESSGVNEGVQDMEAGDESLLEGTTKFSVPTFLRKVFVKEVGDVANGGDHRLLVIAVHAVLLESGFVAYDPISGMKIDGFHLHDEWPISAFGLSLNYTLPELASSEVVEIETVVLRFQTLGKFLNIYGSVGKKGFGARRVCLDEPRFIPALSFILKNKDHSDSGKSSFNREIFEFWRIVKDGLSYPLLMDLCERASLNPPSCFTILPTELKLEILKKLPAVDVARMCCVSSELCFVASNNMLWKLKYEEEFGEANPILDFQWKKKFGINWEVRKKRKRLCMPFSWRDPVVFRSSFPGRRASNPPGFPFIIGGDFDRLPALGIPQHHGSRIFRFNCDLGGFGDP